MSDVDLTSLSENVLKEMERIGYYHKSISQYRSKFQQFIDFAKNKGETFYSEELGLQFLEEKHNYSERRKTPEEWSKLRDTLRVVRLLGDFNLHGAILKRSPQGPKKGTVIRDSYYCDFFSLYKKYCAEQGYGKGTIQSYQNLVQRFLAYLETHGSPKAEEINSSHINGFINTFAAYSYKSNGLYLTALRAFLRFLDSQGHNKNNLKAALPKLRRREHYKIPSVWEKDDVVKLLDAVDRGNPTGIRDYAILLLVVRLGLRCVDIKNLKFESLKWKENLIELIQSKTNKKVSLPLLPDVGWAIIDYMQNGRPKTSSPFVFMQHKCPYKSLGDTYDLYYVIKKYIKVAGLTFPKDQPVGMHSLRHTLASALFENHVPLSAISEILGHISTETTDLYLMTGIDLLRECSLQVGRMENR